MFRLDSPSRPPAGACRILRWHARRTGRAPRPAWLPKGGSDALVQLSLFVIADILYETVRGIAESNAAVAFSNARSIVDLEQSTGLFFEQGLQAWAMGQRVLIDFANFMYVNSHFVITTGVAGVAVPAPQRALLLRAQHVHGGDGARARRLRR